MTTEDKKEYAEKKAAGGSPVVREGLDAVLEFTSGKNPMARKSEIEKKEEINKIKPGILIMAFRNIRLNFDIVLYFVAAFCFVFLGYSLAFIRLSWSVEAIKVSISDFIAIITSIVIGTCTFIGSILVPIGKLRESLESQVNKDSAKLDSYGRTIKG